MQHLGLLSVSVFWLLVIYILWRWPKTSQDSISDHVKSGIPRKLYIAITSISVLAFLVFLVFWFIPEFKLYPIAYLLAVCASFAEIAATIIPRREKFKKMHDNSVNVAGTAILLFNAVIMLSPSLGTSIKIVIAVSSIILLIIGYRLRIYGRRHYLSQQIAFYVLAHASFLFVTYFG